MAVTRKPKSTRDSRETPASVNVDALIMKGGSVAATSASAEKGDKPASVVLRIPPDLLDGIEQAIRTRPIKIPRHTWLLEAVVEKLQRELPGIAKTSD